MKTMIKKSDLIFLLKIDILFIQAKFKKNTMKIDSKNKYSNPKKNFGELSFVKKK